MFGWNTKSPYLCIRFRERNDSSPGHTEKRYLKELHKQRVVQEQDMKVSWVKETNRQERDFLKDRKLQ